MPKITREERQNRVVQKALKAIEARPRDRAAILHELYECAWRDCEKNYGVSIPMRDGEIMPNQDAEIHRVDKPKKV